MSLFNIILLSGDVFDTESEVVGSALIDKINTALIWV